MAHTLTLAILSNRGYTIIHMYTVLNKFFYVFTASHNKDSFIVKLGGEYILLDKTVKEVLTDLYII